MRDRLLAMRDRLLTSARFQRIAAALPFTRPIANAQAQKAFDVCAGFVYSQIASACVHLGILEAVRTEPMSVGSLASIAGLSDCRMQILVNAATAIGLLSARSGGRVGLGSIGAAIVANPGISAMIRHHALLYEDLSDPVALLRGDAEAGRVRKFWTYASGGGREVEETHESVVYSTLMAQSQQLIAGDILAALPFSSFSRILDLGGGDGTFLMALACAVPHVEARLFDLPPVADLANRKFAAAGLSGRCAAVGGDFFREPLPSGFDVLTLVRVLHDHNDDDAARLLRAARRAILPGGTIVVAEPMSGVPGAAVVADAYFGFYLLAMGSGRPRSQVKISELLEAAGFTQARARRTRRPLLVSVVSARAA